MKKIKDITEELESEHGKTVNAELNLDLEVFKRAYAKELKSDKVKLEKNGVHKKHNCICLMKKEII